MYVITGASGNTGKIIAAELMAAGKTVKAISRNTEHLGSMRSIAECIRMAMCVHPRRPRPQLFSGLLKMNSNMPLLVK